MRPIAITSTPCKLMERIIAKYVLSLVHGRLLSNKQFGFLPGRCTTDALIQVLDDWGRAIDNGDEQIIAIFFDFAKAFDLVNHERLLAKIECMLPQWLVKWIAVWLSGRKQRVIYRGKQTRWRDVLAGVIQSSVLRPILFLLFVLDINDYLTGRR
jgi:ribonuclease P/MRP protein subunit RPP40